MEGSTNGCRRIVRSRLRTCVRQYKRQVENLMKIRSHAPGSGRHRQDCNHNAGNLTTLHMLPAPYQVELTANLARYNGAARRNLGVRGGLVSGDPPTLRCAFVDRSPAIRSERRSFPREREDPGLRSPAHPFCRYRPGREKAGPCDLGIGPDTA